MPDDQVPKCVRVMATFIYADGASVSVDIKDPISVKTEVGDLETEGRIYTAGNLQLVSDPQTFAIDVRINQERQIIFSTHPVKD